MLEKLLRIQTELKAPKSQFNSFGKYNYRNVEDILEAVKPLLVRERCALILSDQIVCIEGRHYVKATALLADADPVEDPTGQRINKITTEGYAREEEEKKGMDGSQITGASSSYARKYALNGLFAIDDTKDSDFTNQDDKKSAQKKTLAPAKEPQTDNGLYTKIKETLTIEGLNTIYDSNPDKQKDKDFLAALKTRKIEIQEREKMGYAPTAELTKDQLALFDKLVEQVKALGENDGAKAKKILTNIDNLITEGFITEKAVEGLKSVLVPLATI